VLPNRVGALEAEVRRDFLESRGESGGSLALFNKRQNLLLSVCQFSLRHRWILLRMTV
jgi:hypothetical protein